MKTRLLIIIGIIVALVSMAMILAMNFLDDQKTTAYDSSIEQLEAILEYCIDSKDLVDTIGLAYHNNTHSIDTVTCKWQNYDGVQINSEGFDSIIIRKTFATPDESQNQFIRIDDESFNRQSLQTGETISASGTFTSIIIGSLGPILIALFIVIYAVKKRTAKKSIEKKK